MYRKVAAAFVLTALLSVLSSVADGSIFNTPADELEEDDYVKYATEVGVATAGLGIGLSLMFGFLAFIAMLVMCCRCKRLHHEDVAIVQAEADSEGKGLEDMYEIEDYEDKISRHRKILWVSCFIIFMGYLFCAGYTYIGARTTDAAFDDIFDGIDVLVTKLQTALCAENGSSECENQSVGDFLLDIADAVFDQFDGIVEFLSSLSAVATPLYWVSANLTTAGTVINGTEKSVLNINESISNINLIFNGDGNVADVADGSAIPTLDASILEDVAEGKSAIATAKTLTEDSIVEVEDQLFGSSSTITRIEYQLDDIHGNEIDDDEDVRNSSLEAVYEVLEPIHDMTEAMYEFQNNELVDARHIVEEYLETSVHAVVAIIFLPGVILLLTSICSGMFQSSKPLYLNMCFVFLSQIVFCLVAGVFLAASKINGDVCDNHLELVEANLQNEYNISVEDTVVTLTYDKVYLILTCDGIPGDVPTETNNFVSILEAEQVFNMSKQLETASSVITNSSDLLLSPKSTVIDAQDELSLLSDFVNMTIGDDVDIAELSDEINDLLDEMPPSPFNWDSRVHQDALDNFYLSNVTEFSWNNETTGNQTYRSRLEEINKIIGEMVPGVIGGYGFYDIEDPYNFTLARNLTWISVCAETSNFFPDPANSLKSKQQNITIYTYEYQGLYLCGNVSAYANITEKLEELISENDETRLDLEEVSINLDKIDGNITTISDYQIQMGLLRDDMNDSLIYLIENLDDLVEDLEDLAADLLELNEYFMAASNYTMCGYIGTFYEAVYLDAMCTDLQRNAEAVAGPAVCVVILMFVSFCVQGCYGPSMRKRPRHTAGVVDGNKMVPNDVADETSNLNIVAGDGAALSIPAEEHNLDAPYLPTPMPVVETSGV